MRILGLDPGTGIFGFGIIEADKAKYSLVDGGVIRTPPHQAEAIRLETIYQELTDIVAASKPKVMSIEMLYFAKNIKTAMSVSQARGVALLVGRLSGLAIFEYTPLQIKQALTGYGRADKKQIQEMVRVMLGLKKVPQPDDCADALAAAITHSMTMR